MAIIQIKGAIVSDNDKWIYEWLEKSATAPKDILLPDTAEDLEVIINSGGGDVYAGSEIYTMLRGYAGKVTVKVVGIAASAASVIAMAGDVIEISPTAQIMIHNVSTRVEGDSNRLHKEAEVLDNFNVSIANAYLAKTGKTMDELLNLMNQTTWFNAQQAVEQGFADKVMFEAEEVISFVANTEELISKSVAEKLSNLVHQNKAPVGDIKVNIDYTLLAKAIAAELGHDQVEEAKEEAPKGFGAFCF